MAAYVLWAMGGTGVVLMLVGLAMLLREAAEHREQTRPAEPAELTDHRFVVKIEDGYTSWRIICPDNGAGCGPANACASCGRSVGDVDTAPCYDCPNGDEAEGCWIQSWVGEAMAEEVLSGTVEFEFPVRCEWNGDGLEAHVTGPVLSRGSS